MRFIFLTGVPYTFYAETQDGETTKYTISHYKSVDETEETIEVSPETWDRLLRAQQIEHLGVIANALDGDHGVSTGRLPSIARRLNDIADQIAPSEDEEHVLIMKDDEPS